MTKKSPIFFSGGPILSNLTTKGLNLVEYDYGISGGGACIFEKQNSRGAFALLSLTWGGIVFL